MKIAALTALGASLLASVTANSHSQHGQHKKRDNSLATIKHEWNTRTLLPPINIVYCKAYLPFAS